jgi:invasion protein IalB
MEKLNSPKKSNAAQQRGIGFFSCLSFACFSMSGAIAQQPEVSKYGVWETQCEPSTNGKVCALVQTVTSEELPNVGIMAAVRKVPGAPYGVIQFFAPPRTFLLEGVGIKVDQDQFGKLRFFRCTQTACVAEAPITSDLLSKMLNGKSMLITIYGNPGEGLRHIFTLDGFKDRYKALPE